MKIELANKVSSKDESTDKNKTIMIFLVGLSILKPSN